MRNVWRKLLTPPLQELHPVGDYRGSAEYRHGDDKILVRRAIFTAWEKARRR